MRLSMSLKHIIIILFLFSSPLFAWNSVGHRVIAQIAYDQLTPIAKEKVDALTAVLFHSKYPEARFLKAATWPDSIRKQMPQYTSWHYIDLPFVKDNAHSFSPHTENVVTEIANAETIVANSANTDARRAQYLSFLIHFVGDIHQPLHCVTLYSAQFPKGDKGGNRYLIHTAIASNLHAYWDEGLGLFYSVPGNYQFRYNQVENIATQWMAQYPAADFGAQLQDLSAATWAQESYKIATTFVYQAQLNATPSQSYVQQGQIIVRKQVVLAGDRLAAVLNKLFE